MRTAIFVAAVARVAAAEPDAREQCKAERRARMTEAMAIADVQERGRRLLAIPECAPPPEHVEPAPIPQPAPPQRGLALALAGGTSFATSSYQINRGTSSPTAPNANSALPFVEVELMWRLGERLSLGGFASYVPFRDASYLDVYDVRRDELGAGARVGVHVGRVRLVGSLGAAIDSVASLAAVPDRNFIGVPGYTTTLLTIGLGADCTLARSGRWSLSLDAAMLYARTIDTPTVALAFTGDSFAARVGLRVQLATRAPR